MKKKIISVLLALLVLFVSQVAVFAHPEFVREGSHGTVSNLITVKKPDTATTSTVKSTYSITGVGSVGVSVCFYLFDGTAYQPQKNADGTLATYTIGSSGVFYRQISLKEGTNRILVRAQAPDGNYQLKYLTINVVKSDVVADVQAFSLNVQSKLNGWLN